MMLISVEEFIVIRVEAKTKHNITTDRAISLYSSCRMGDHVNCQGVEH